MAILTDASYRFKLISLIVLLPLCIAFYGYWQHWRVVTIVSADLQQLDQDSEELQKALATHGRKVRVRLKDDKTVSAVSLLREIDSDRYFLCTAMVWGERSTFLACALGLVGSLIGVLGLWFIHRAGGRALLSRDALLESFQRGLKQLPWLVGASGLLIALGLACVLAYELFNFAFFYMKEAAGGVKLLVMGIIGVGALLLFGLNLVRNMVKASRAVFEREPLYLHGRSVTETEAPRLWAFVRNVAEKAGTVMPESIILGLNECFFVTQAPVELAGQGLMSGRVLYLPLPYMHYLSRHEAAMIIGHELGHFTGKDTEYSLRFSPMYAGAVNSLRAVSGAAASGGEFTNYVSKPALLLCEYYLNAFHLAVQHWSRERELAADQMGIIAGGKDALALSLLHTSMLAPFVDKALEECWEEGRVPDEGLVPRMRELLAEYEVGDPEAYLEMSLAHPMDSHPTTMQRLEAAGLVLTQELLEQARVLQESSLLHDLGLVDTCPEAMSSSLSATLAAQLAQRAKEQREERRAVLISLKDDGLDSLVVYESVLGVVVSAVFLLLLCGGLLFVRKETMVLLALAGGCLLVSGVGLYYFLRARKPLITMTPSGFQLANMQVGDEEIPWLAVASISFHRNYSKTLIVHFELEDDYAAPDMQGDSRVSYLKEAHTITLRAEGFCRPLKGADAFCLSLGDHWRGATARATLEAMDANDAMPPDAPKASASTE